jgi:2-oxoglutarate dehydrogenase E1 component
MFIHIHLNTYRQEFGEDSIIDMICYRRFGHNELDQPAYTQPVLYNKISKHPDTLAVYEKELISTGTCEQKEIDEIKAMVSSTLQSEFDASKDWVTPKMDWLSSRWSGFLSPNQHGRIRKTGYAAEKLKEIGIKMSSFPTTLNVHRQLEKIFATRRDTIEKGAGIDWGTAEVYVYECSYLYIYIHIFICIHIHTYIYLHIYVHINLPTYIGTSLWHPSSRR